MAAQLVEELELYSELYMYGVWEKAAGQEPTEGKQRSPRCGRGSALAHI